jgi:hypothetical protein
LVKRAPFLVARAVNSSPGGEISYLGYHHDFVMGVSADSPCIAAD